MSDGTRDVTEEYRIAELASLEFDPGKQPDIGRLMRQAFVRGYATALIDMTAPTVIEVQK